LSTDLLACGIREAEAADAPRIVALLEQLGYRENEGDIAERLGMSGYERQVFVAESAAGVIGCVSVSLSIRIVGGLRADIESFVVDESARGRGVGASLLEAAEAWARAKASARLRLLSNVVRERAHAFYERSGYVKVKAEYVLEKVL
jgi:GNAT superfamily N-acetyltransferase